MKYLKITISFLLIIVIIICIFFIKKGTFKYNEQLGIQVLTTLYEFETVDEFEKNMEEFQNYVSEDVFYQMTVDNTDRVLGVYLKLKGNSCNVDIVESTSNYIVYHLISNSIERERLFLFCFSVENGKIIEIKEAELFPFPTTYVWR